jgi:acyl carrier protein
MQSASGPGLGPEEKANMTDPVFFEPSRRITAAEVALLTGAELLDPALGETSITGVASSDEAGAGRLVFVESPRQAAAVEGAGMAALLCPPKLSGKLRVDAAILVTEAPRKAFAQVGRLLFPDSVRPRPVTGQSGVSPAAHIHPDARLEEGVTVEAETISGQPELTFADLGVESLGVLGVVAALENRYGIRLGADAEQCERPEQLRELITQMTTEEATDARAH